MKKMLTSAAIVAALASSSAFAGSASVQQSYLGGGTDISSAATFHNQHQVTVENANLPSNDAMDGLYIGSK